MVCTILFSGCARPTPPEWYLHPQGGAVVCGDGSGEIVQEAKEQSIASLSHSVGIVIDAQDEYRYDYHRGGVESSRSSYTNVHNLFPTLSRLVTERYEIKKNGYRQGHFVRTCVKTDDVANAIEEILNDDEAWLLEMNPKAMCLGREGREKYTARKGEILSRLSLLRAYRSDSAIIEKIESVGYAIPQRLTLNVVGDSSLIDPALSQSHIITGKEGGMISIQSRGEIHSLGKGSKNYTFLYVLRVSVELNSPCGEKIYASNEKCVDEGKTKEAAIHNARLKMQRLLANSGLKDALNSY
jgi:hypothetical protein